MFLNHGFKNQKQQGSIAILEIGNNQVTYYILTYITRLSAALVFDASVQLKSRMSMQFFN